MQNTNKALMLSTLILAAIVVGVLAQTIYRNRQVEALRVEIKDAVKNANDPNEAVSVIQSYEEQIKYAYDHKPLLNLDIGLTNSFAGQSPALCQNIYKVMTSNTVVKDFLDNTNLAVADKPQTLQQIQEIQQGARGLYLISGCLP